MKNLDGLLWESVFNTPFTGVRATVFLALFVLTLLLLAPFVRARIPLTMRLMMHVGVLLFLPIMFIMEHTLLSQPAVIAASRVREGGVCLMVVDATIKRNAGVYMLVLEEGESEVRYLHVPWEVRFAQAMSRAKRTQEKVLQQGKRPGAIYLGGKRCMPRERARRQEISDDQSGTDSGVFILENFPTPYPDKVELEGELPHHP